jgi:spermidine synthase
LTLGSAPAARTRLLTVLLFFASGISGLIYQVVWVRQFGNVFGNTMHSAALVTGVFMCGLGVGSWVVGRYADRRFEQDPTAPLALYAYSELLIAALGIFLALAIPALEGVSASISSYRAGAHGWNELSAGAYAFRYLIAIVLLMPPSLLMGGTLTLLIRFLVGTELSLAGWRIGLLYGVNTAGAALGALLTDLSLVPGVGVLGTQLVAAALNTAAGIGALVLLRRGDLGVRRQAPAEPEGPQAEAAPIDARARRLLILTATALFLSGLAAMGIEMLWFRFLTQINGAFRSVFSLMLAVILVGIWLGSTTGGWLNRRYGKPVVMFILAQAALVVCTLALLSLIDHARLYLNYRAQIRAEFVAASAGDRSLMAVVALLRSIVPVVALPAFLMGFTFPVANAHAQRATEAVGARAGGLYLGNTLGNVVGSVAVGFVALPHIGIRYTTLALTCCAALSVVPMYLSARALPDDTKPNKSQREQLRRVFVAGLAIAGLAIVGFMQLPPQLLLSPAVPRANYPGLVTVLMSEGLNETLAVAEVPGVRRALYTNGHPMSANGGGSQRYMRAFSHIPLLHLDNPTDVLVICFGVGNTLHAASLHPSVERLEVADLSRNVLEHGSYFKATNRDVLSHPKVKVFVNDGRQHLRMQPPERYDLVTLEPPPIPFAGVSALYTREFYQLARSKLKPGGYLTQWVPAYQVPGEVVLSMVRAFVDVFPQSVLLSGHGRELILMGTTADSLQLDPKDLERRLSAAPDVREDLDNIYMGSAVDFYGTFAASAEHMVAATRGVDALSDDRPIIEYKTQFAITVVDLPAALFDVRGIESWCPGCNSKVEGLADYLYVRDKIYQSSLFLNAGASLSFEDARARDAITKYEYLRYLLEGDVFHVTRIGRAHLAHRDDEAAVAALSHATHLSPGDPDAHYFLGVALRRTGHRDQAEKRLQETLRLFPAHPRANAVMCKRAARKQNYAEAISRCDVALRSGLSISEELQKELAPHRE